MSRGVALAEFDQPILGLGGQHLIAAMTGQAQHRTALLSLWFTCLKAG